MLSTVYPPPQGRSFVATQVSQQTSMTHGWHGRKRRYSKRFPRVRAATACGSPVMCTADAVRDMCPPDGYGCPEPMKLHPAGCGL